jgi:hypothetical protein
MMVYSSDTEFYLRPVLKVETPFSITDACTDFSTLWAKGLSEEDFWSLFVQCSLCRMVMPHDVFSGTHGMVCRVQREIMGWSNDNDHSGHDDADSISGDTEIIDWDDDDSTDDEVGPIICCEEFPLKPCI